MIYWLLQSSTDLDPDQSAWLSPVELARFAELKIDKRRHDWLLGRWTAKRLLQTCAARLVGARPPLSSLIIQNDEDGAPFSVCDLQLGVCDLALSLSHSHDHAFCALADVAALGADIEHIEPRSETFVNDYFTPAEIALVQAAAVELRPMWVTAIWSAKESALKTLRLGLSVDTRSIECRVRATPVLPGDWISFEIDGDPARLKDRARRLVGWWRVAGEFVLTLAVDDPLTPAAL